MKFLAIFVILLAYARAKSISDVIQKFVPSFSTGFVIKGHEAAPHSAPYIVSISASIKHKHICGGTIIDNEWILTAAHCIRDPINMSVVAGLHERLNFDNKTQARIVDWGKIHEKFSGGVGPYDIAILHLSEPLNYNQYVQPAALPAPDEIYTGEAYLYGWGQPKFYEFSGSKVLQTVQTEVMELSACKEALPKDSPIHETNICTDAMGKGVSACNGDSGGPLVIEHEDAPSELIGIVSWGYIPCGVAKKPSVYTRVASYIDWIEKIQNAYHILY